MYGKLQQPNITVSDIAAPHALGHMRLVTGVLSGSSSQLLTIRTSAQLKGN